MASVGVRSALNKRAFARVQSGDGQSGLSEKLPYFIQIQAYWGDKTAKQGKIPQRSKKKTLKRVVLAFCLAFLAACTEGDFSGVGPSPTVGSISLLGGDLIVAGPSGYCVDPDLSHQEDRFVVLGGCDVLSNGGSVGPSARAVLMVSVSPDRSADSASIRQLIAATGSFDANNQRSNDGVHLVQLKSGGSDYLSGGDEAYWRGVTTVNGYLVIMTAISQNNGAATRKSGGDVLLALAKRIREKSPDRILPKPPKLRPDNLTETRIAGL